ncbi:hypothetical protein VT52_034915 [Streptomyces malaysiense]|uniref:Type IV secretion protein Rhs n=2 Tax=Streptomyces malaysiense TaxID=1428626 RepID=A0A1J4PT84_9ACTN|nr:hypothetical protein VT52_034915 [Streptomyces malaysiense]
MGQAWSYVYDEAGRLVAETDFNGRTLAYAHDPVGGLVSRTNGAGETLTFTRDALGRVVEQRSSTDDATTYAYAPTGQLAHARAPEAEVVYERDELGRALSETVNGGTTVHAYDALGRRIRRTTPSGLTSHWKYDSAGRCTELGSEAGSLSFTYDAGGRETERRLGEEVTLSQGWDAAGRLTVQSLTSASVPSGADHRLLQYREYAYRADGYLTGIRELTAGARSFDLDGTGRVTGVRAHGWTETYAYDRAGNLTHAAASQHEAPGDREFEGTVIRRAGNTTYEHDGQGRLVTKTRRLLNGKRHTWTYTWNAEDRLTAVTTPDGSRWRYSYDPLGRRIAKSLLSDDGSPVEHVEFTWDDTCLAERSTLDGMTTTWEYAPGTHRPLAQTDHWPSVPSSEMSFLARLAEETTTDRASRFHAVITDAAGTPTELVAAGGAVAWQRRTSLWGTPLSPGTEAESVECPLRFPGQYHDAETGLHYNYFRFYDPETAGYLSPDPLGLDPAPNHHAYIVNPFRWIDPTGLVKCTQEALDKAFEMDNTPRKLEHVIDPPKHGFEEIVKNSGGRSEAFRRILDSLGESDDLPESGGFVVDRTIDGETVTIRGAMVNGIPRIGTAFIQEKFPGKTP